MRHAIAILLVAAAPALARAEGYARGSSGFLRDAYVHVQVTVDGDIARTVVTQVFVNDLDSPIEASYAFPLPADAAVTGFAEWHDGRRVEARAEDRDRASRDYDRAADSGRKAGLAESDGASRFQMKLAQIPAHGTRRVELAYSQTLQALGGERTYVFPAERGEAPPPTLLDLAVTLAGDRPILSLSSVNQPDARIARDRLGHYAAFLSRAHEGLARDLVLRWQEESRPLDLAARAVRAHAGEPAWIEARLAFNADPSPMLHQPVDVVIAIDTSLSMAGEPLARAQALAAQVLHGLTSSDRVELVTFGDGVDAGAGALEPVTGPLLDHLGARVAALRASGRTNLAAAVDEAADRLRGSQNGLLVLMTDGQPTVGDEDGKGAATRGDFGRARVVIAHFNYPSRRRALEALFPNVTTRYVPDGPAGDDAIGELGRLAVAPMIEELKFQLVGGGVREVAGAIPDRLAVGESIRVMARADSDLLVRMSGRLHGRSISLTVPIAVPPSPDGRGDRGLPVEWARLQVRDLETRLDAAPDDPEAGAWRDRIRALGKQYGLMTRFTSFVVSDSLSPDRIEPGDPEIRIHAPRSALGVRALLPWGEVVECVWQPDEEVWLGRFLVPRGVPDGLYRVRVFVDGQSGTRLRTTLLFRVDSRPPTFVLGRDGDGPVAPGERLRLTARVAGDVFDRDHDGIRRDLVDVKQIVVEVGGLVVPLERAGDDEWRAELPIDLPPGHYTVRLLTTDFAGNASEATMPIEVR